MKSYYLKTRSINFVTKEKCTHLYMLGLESSTLCICGDLLLYQRDCKEEIEKEFVCNHSTNLEYNDFV